MTGSLKRAINRAVGTTRSLWLVLWRFISAPPIVAADNGLYIASARRHALLVVVLGAFGAQLAWEESEWRRVTERYAYIEKVLVVCSAAGGYEPRQDADAELKVAGELNWDA